MVSFSVTAISAFLLSAAAGSTATTTTSSSNHRHLSFELIAGYEPASQVTDHNAIDLDQEAIQEQLALANDDAYAAALELYTNGAFSKSVADVKLDTPLGVSISKGQQILGKDASGDQVVGKAYQDYGESATEILIQYATTDSQKNYVNCQVGANPNPNTEGCFAASGSITMDVDGNESSVSYSYDPLTKNINKRSIMGFSTAAEDKMGKCEACPYKMYEQFYDYYGSYDYANQIVLAAFAGSETTFNNFNNDYGLYDFEGKEQIIKKATVYMNVWMYVIREMEDALDDCQEGCTIENCNDDPVHAWDEGVAFYTGSLEGTDGSGDGVLLYGLADKRCANFRTCGDMGDETSGTSHVNIEIFEQFSIGQGKLIQGQCSSAREQKEKIEQLMLVPLIQGALRYAYKTQESQGWSEKGEAEGAIFAASVLPAVAACDKNAAQTIADNMKVGQSGTVDYKAVKAAFEKTYECMGVNPDYVGGLYDAATQSYYDDEDVSAGSTMMASTVVIVASSIIGSIVSAFV